MIRTVILNMLSKATTVGIINGFSIVQLQDEHDVIKKDSIFPIVKPDSSVVIALEKSLDVNNLFTQTRVLDVFMKMLNKKPTGIDYFKLTQQFLINGNIKKKTEKESEDDEDLAIDL